MEQEIGPLHTPLDNEGTQTKGPSVLIVTADDYGKTRHATDSILVSFSGKRITSTSAMVFMQDSERAASLALEKGLEVGLHLNFTQPFSGHNVSSELREHHDKVVAYLSKHKFSQLVYNPFLAQSFHVLFLSQQQEFLRLYGRTPDYYNGHHHMHLCTNLLARKLIPHGARVRRTFTFESGERSVANAAYRRLLSSWVSKRFLTTHAFFTIIPIDDHDRLRQIFSRAATQTIELEVHPENAEELEFLLSDEYENLISGVQTGGFRALQD